MFLNACGKIINAETLLDENMFLHVWKGTFIKVDQLRYDSLRYISPGTHCF